jgi:alanine dehydrogenase
VFVERDAGAGAGFPDEEYAQAGGKILDDHSSVFQQGELIIKVKEPLPSEYPLLREGQILFTYLHLAANKALTEALMRSGVTAVAYETVEMNRRLPLLEPMSEIAGRMSIIVGGFFLAKHRGGKGGFVRGRAWGATWKRDCHRRWNFGNQCDTHGYGFGRRCDHP